MQIKLRNRLHRVDNIAGATIEFVGPTGGAPVLTLTTNGHGIATLAPAALPAGTYTCRISAPHTSADPVGPALVSAGAVPDRVYRPVTLTVVRTLSGIASALPTNPLHATVAVAGNVMTVDVQPVWIRSSAHSARGQGVSMVVVHHTGCNTSIAVNTFLAEKGPHYMIDVDGQIVKWVQDVRAAWHAGEARWQGNSDINARSIGIEIVHVSGDYPAVQYEALIGLLERLRAAHTGIDAWSIVGHGDVGTNAQGRLGRKSGDPGLTFDWGRLEARSLGLQMVAGPPSPLNYGGIYQLVPPLALRRGDNDARHRFGGATHTGITGTPVRELQEDLAGLGYSVGRPDGDFGDRTHYAVYAFQEHFFGGGRGHKAPDGRVDYLTAGLIKSVVTAASILRAPLATTGAVGGGAVGGGVPTR
jgi:N-acetylmuramoyl-L-alanine amidase